METLGPPPELLQRPLPRHIAIIMDGNGRWARQRGMPRIEGHRRGAESVRDIVRAARALGIEALTLYAFSEQNWDRPSDEVSELMSLLHQYVLEERDEIMDNAIRLVAIGRLEQLPGFVRQALLALIEASSDNDRMFLALALSYGGREDIVDAVRSLARDARDGKLEPEAIDEAAVEQRLSTAALPPPDLLIRTSGERRLSNFLLWELAYAEMIFVQTMWPDFRRAQLYEAVAEFQQRERRFGRTSDQVSDDQPAGDQVSADGGDRR